MTTMLPEEKSRTSKHIRGSDELLLIIPIKPGFIDSRDTKVSTETVSYATRLKALLGVLFEFRKYAADISLKDTPQPIDLLRTIYAAQWTVLENELKLLVAVTFDRSWEEYFARLQVITGDLLDLLFMHCVGYEGHTSRDGFDNFTDWIRAQQRETNFLFHFAPDLTTDDVHSLSKLVGTLGHALQKSPQPDLRQLALQHHLEPDILKAVRDPVPTDSGLRNGLRVLSDLREYFPSDEVLQLRARGEGESSISAQAIYDASVRSLLGPALRAIQMREDEQKKQALQSSKAEDRPGQVERVLSELQSDASAWVKRFILTPPAPSRQSTPTARVPHVEAGEVQANILQALPDRLTCGAVVLVQCDGPAETRAFLERQRASITWETGVRHCDRDRVYRNLALTYGGLVRMQLPEATLKRFPKEFREGMEQRAGLLGDVGAPNHPYYWEEPRANRGRGRRLSLSAVDVVLVLQTSSRTALAAALSQLESDGAVHGYRVVHTQALEREFVNGRLHDAFGLSEGSSQPCPQVDVGGHVLNAVDAHGKAETAQPIAPIDRVALGELLLGHPDRSGTIAQATKKPAPCTTQPAEPDDSELFMNGTFMVMRKLEQHVERWNEALARWSSAIGASTASVIDAIIGDGRANAGRGSNGNGNGNGHKSGPNGHGAHAPNDFDYNEPARAAGCPLHAHVRLANPRVSSLDPLHSARHDPHAAPRILRRGFSYCEPGADGKKTRGLMFMAYNASISGQYEVIQRWLNAGNPTGLLSWQNDLLTGPRLPRSYPRHVPAKSQRASLLARAGAEVRRRLNGDLFARVLHVSMAAPVPLAARAPASKLGALAHDVLATDQAFVSLRWGVYLFVPSHRALRWLVASRPSASDPSDVKAGEEIIARLDGLEHLAQDEAARGAVKLEWKRFLEDPTFDTQARQIWAAIRRRFGGRKHTAYGVLVAGQQQAKQVLNDDGRKYSVCTYAERLGPTLGERDGQRVIDHYLGLDAHTEDYKTLAQANRIFAELLTPERAYADAHAAALAVLAALPRRSDEPRNHGQMKELDVADDFARPVVRRLAEQWFGLPKARDPHDRRDAYFQYFIDVSRYSFQPHPERHFEPKLLQQRQREMRLEAYPVAGLIGDELVRRGYPQRAADPAAQRVVLTGAVAGFSAPAIAAITSVLDKWTESDELGWLSEYVHTRHAEREQVVLRMLYEALARRPVPPILYRTDTACPARSDQSLVVLGLASLYRDAQETRDATEHPDADAYQRDVAVPWFFGGLHHWEQPPADAAAIAPHACPARSAAIAVLRGAVTALLEQDDLRRERRGLLKFR